MQTHPNKQGSALILVLWTVILITLLIGSFAFEMHIEAKIATLQRQRFKAREMAQAGFEYARAILATQLETDDDNAEAEEDEFQLAAARIRRGLNLEGLSYALPDGTFSLSIRHENAKHNINKLESEDWDLLLEQSGFDETTRSVLYDCYLDWTDEDDLHELNGAESDDEFYEEQNYRCKNAAVESIRELALIKNFTQTVLEGGTTEEGETVIGLTDQLTVWGDGRININSASRETLLTFLDLDELEIDELLSRRDGIDGLSDTEDDGFDSLNETGLSKKEFTTDSQWMQIISLAQTEQFTYEIRAIVYLDRSELQILEWEEGFATSGASPPAPVENPPFTP
jgi:general secretion pathway protein K